MENCFLSTDHLLHTWFLVPSVSWWDCFARIRHFVRHKMVEISRESSRNLKSYIANN